VFSGVPLPWLKQVKPESQHPYSLLKLGMCGVTLPPLHFIAFCSIVLLIFLNPFSVTQILQYRVADLRLGCERKPVMFPEVLEKNYEKLHSG